MSHIPNKPSHEDLRKQAEIVYSLLSMLSSNENFDEPPLVALLHDKNLYTKQKDGTDMSASALEALMKLSFDDKQRQAICYLGGLQAIALMLENSNKEFGSSACNENVIRSRLHACMALTNLTFGFAKNKSILCSIDNFVVTVIDQLKSPNEELRRVAASVLRNLSWKADADAKVVMKEAGIVPGLLTAAMEAEKESTLKCILDALWNISAHSVENKAEICDFPGSLEFIVSLLTYSSPSNTSTIVENGGGILRNISSHIAVHEHYRMVLRRQNCFEILLKHLQSSNLNIVSNACGTLWNLSARCVEDQQTLWRLGAVRFLGNLVDSDHKAISIASSAALKNLLLYKSNTSSLFTSCSSSPIEEKGKENKTENCDSHRQLNSAVCNQTNQLKSLINANKLLVRPPIEVKSTDCLKVRNTNTLDVNLRDNLLRFQGPPLKSNNFTNKIDGIVHRNAGYDIDDSIDEPIDFSTKFKEINLENATTNQKSWLNNDFVPDKKLTAKVICSSNSLNNNSNLNVNSFTYPLQNIKDPRIMQLQLKINTKEVPDVVKQITSLCHAYTDNSGFSSPVEHPKHYCTEDTPDGFSITNGSLCDINELDCSKNDYFQYASSNPMLNFIANNNTNNKYNLLLNKSSTLLNQNSVQNFNINTSKLMDYYEEAKDEPIDFSTKYQEILPDKYPNRSKWPCPSFDVYKQPVFTSANNETHVVLKDQSSILASNLSTQKNSFPNVSSQKENLSLLENKCLNVALNKAQVGNSCSPNDVPKQYCTEDTPIGYSRASSLSSLSMKSSELEHNDHSKVHADKITETITLPSIHENETLSITPMDSKISSQSSKSTGKSSGSSESNSHHNSGPKTVTFDETNQTPMMFSRCSSLGSLSSFDARSVHSSVVSEYSRRASGVVSPSDLPDSPGGTMPPSPKNKPSDTLDNPQKRFERIHNPVGEQDNDVKNDSDCSLSDNEDGYDDDLLSEVIQAAMPKSRKHSRVTYEVINQYSNDDNVKMMMARKSYISNSESIITNKTFVPQPQQNQHITSLDTNHDTLKTYAVEGTPLEISRFTSLSDLSIDDSVSGKKVKKETNPRKHISVQPQKTLVESQNIPLEDSLKTYNFEGTPINFSRNDSLSSLGSKDFSSPGKPDAEVHPKLKKMQIFLKTFDNVHSVLPKNITSTPCSKAQQALGDEILRYAVEGTPDKIPPISYDDASVGGDEAVSSVLNNANQYNADITLSGRKNDSHELSETQIKKNKSSSSSSLSFDSSDSDGDDSPIKNDLLQECINVALPKGKSRKTKQNLIWNQKPQSKNNNSLYKNVKNVNSDVKSKSEIKVKVIENAGTSRNQKINHDYEVLKDGPQYKSDSLKKAVYVTNAIHEANIYSEEDDCSISGPSTEANNTVIYRGPNGAQNPDESNEDTVPLDDVLYALNSAITPVKLAIEPSEDNEQSTREVKSNLNSKPQEVVTPFSMDNINLLSSHSLNLPGLILTEENSTVLNLSPSLLSKSADPILSSEMKHSKNKPKDDFKEFSDLIDDFYHKTCLHELESSRFDMKYASADTASNIASDTSDLQSTLYDNSLSSNSSIPNTIINQENGAEKKHSKNKLLNFFRKHSIKKPKSTSGANTNNTKMSDSSLAVAETNLNKKVNFNLNFGKPSKKK